MGFLLVYDVADEDSFNSIHQWMREIEKYALDKDANKVCCIPSMTAAYGMP